MDRLSDVLLVDTPGHVVEYLTFYCAHRWGTEGATVVRPGSVKVGREPSSGSWRATAEVAYGSGYREATFRIEESGRVIVVGNRPIADVATRERAAEYVAFYCARLWGREGSFCHSPRYRRNKP